MVYICVNFIRVVKVDLSVYVGVIYVYLVIMGVDDVVDFFNLWFENIEGVGVGDYNGINLFGVLFVFGLKVFEI